MNIPAGISTATGKVRTIVQSEGMREFVRSPLFKTVKWIYHIFEWTRHGGKVRTWITNAVMFFVAYLVATTLFAGVKHFEEEREWYKNIALLNWGLDFISWIFSNFTHKP